MIRLLAEASARPVTTRDVLEVTDLALNEQSKIQFIGMTRDENFHSLLRAPNQSISGCVFIIDFGQRLAFDYKKYFIRQFISEYDIPLVIGVMYVTRFTEQVIGELRKKLEIPADIPVLPVNAGNFGSVRNLLFRICQD